MYFFSDEREPRSSSLKANEAITLTGSQNDVRKQPDSPPKKLQVQSDYAYKIAIRIFGL
jgi:hypothetical protein